MKLSSLKKEILLVLLSGSDMGNPCLSVGIIVNEIKKRRSSSNPLNFVCVQHSLERLSRDGLVNVDMSRNPRLHSYFLNSRGKRKAREITAEIRNYMSKWWKFVK